MRKIQHLCRAVMVIAAALAMSVATTASAADIAGIDFNDGSGGYSVTPDDLNLADFVTTSGPVNIGGGSFGGAADAGAQGGRVNLPVGRVNGPTISGTPPGVGASAPADGAFFSITIPEGVFVDLTNVSWVSSKATGGGNLRHLSFKTSLDSTLLYSQVGVIRPGFDNVSIPLSGAPYENLTNTTVDFQWYAGGEGTGDMDIDEILIEGNVSGTPPPPPVFDPTKPNVLFLGGAATPSAGSDGEVMTYLQDRYGEANVTYMRANVADDDVPGSIAGFDVAVLSSTPGSGDYRNKFNNADIGIVNWEEAVSDNAGGEFGLATAVSEKSITTTQINLAGPHPITDGLPSTLTLVGAAGPETASFVSTFTGVDVLGSAVDGVKSSGGGPTAGGGSVVGNAMILVADEGQLVDPATGSSPAANRRVMLPYTDNTFANLTADGQQLLGQSVDWAAVPEPSSVVLFALGMIGMAVGYARRRNNKK